MKTYWHRRANISIGEVTTLPAGSDATASVTEDNVLSLGIPQGAQGEQGDTGPTMTYDGMSSADKTALTNAIATALPYATASNKGVFKLGSGLAMSDGVLSATGNIEPIETMTAATASTAGTGGTVPAPAAGKQNAFLRGDATWAAAPYPGNATTSAAGLMSAADKSKLDNIESSATHGWTNLLYNNTNVTARSTYSFEVPGDIASYHFLMIEFLCRIGYSESKTVIVKPITNGPHTNDRIIKEALQYNGFTSNKNGSRSFSATSNGSTTTFYMERGYFDGSANDNVCIPTKIFGVTL